MKYLLFTFLFCLIFIGSYGQYNDPYRMAYDGSNYYITNKGNGTISKLTNAGTQSTIVTGLDSPNDIFFGAVAGNSVIIILDSNIIKIYDSTTFSPLLSVPITGALEAHDGMFNPNNTNEFFISDRTGNKIIKGTIGSAPFYPITFNTLTSNITKPAGMILNSSGKLIVVSDTIDGNIYEVNITTGSKTTVLASAHDNMNDVAQDNEGNYYITNWGDSKLYRYSNTWTNPFVVATYNNPSGLYADLNNGILGLCCTNCQKVEFKLFHLFSPLSDVSTCIADSFNVSLTPTYQGIGTYNSGNRFTIEMSDSNGNFSNSTEIGSIQTTTPPNNFKASVPSGIYASTGYKYRLTSTSPVVFSYFTKDIVIQPKPIASFYGGDTLYGCKDAELNLVHFKEPNKSYSFFPPVGIYYLDSSKFLFTSSVDSTYNFLFQVQDTITGCTEVSPLVIVIKDALQLGLQDTLNLCKGNSVAIGEPNIPYEFIWSGSTDLSSFTDANPIFSGTTSTQINVTYNDSSGTCFGNDSVFLNVNNLPFQAIILEQDIYCKGDSIAFYIPDSDTLDFVYSLENLPRANNKWIADSLGTFAYTLVFTDKRTGCFDLAQNSVIVQHIGDSIRIAHNSTDTSIDAIQYNTLGTGSLIWMINGNAVTGDKDTISTSRLKNGDQVYTWLYSDDECELRSNTITWQSLSVPRLDISFQVIPNPSNGKIQIVSEQHILGVRIIDLSGRLMYEDTSIQNQTINKPELSGIYILEIKTVDGIGRKRVLFY
ncbi:MAG: hypothetical protein COA58_14440 [Bacteroidetes bacterium]|nr:MAG: hypothetical protein COA58_14440 [Bacteroidota bacterium]